MKQGFAYGQGFGFPILRLDQDAEAYLEEYSPSPTIAYARVLNDLVLHLKASERWDIPTHYFPLYLPRVEDDANSLINLKDPTGPRAQTYNSPIWTPKHGWSGNGIDAYIEWHSVSNDSFGHIAVDVTELDPRTTTQLSYLGNSAGGSSQCSIVTGADTEATFSRYGSNATAQTSPSALSVGYKVCARFASNTTRRLYSDGVLVGTSSSATGATITTGLASHTTESRVSYSAATIALVHAGAGRDVSGLAVVDLNTAWQKFKLAVDAMP